ncbi:unnamed protein product [Brassica oleracea var. botrytis]
MSTSYHPLTYCQLERTTENLNDMFRDCVGWNFGNHLPLPEFAYIDNYLSSKKKKKKKKKKITIQGLFMVDLIVYHFVGPKWGSDMS